MQPIRPLTPNDAPDLLNFYNGLSPMSIRMFRPLGLSTSLEVCQQIAAENGMSPAPRFDLVACGPAEIIAWVFIRGLDTLEPELGIAVADNHQGQGLGKALLTHILSWAGQHGLAAVYLIAVQDNERALHLYNSFGFKTYGEEIGGEDQLPYFQMVAHLPPAV